MTVINLLFFLLVKIIPGFSSQVILASWNEFKIIKFYCLGYIVEGWHFFT